MYWLKRRPLRALLFYWHNTDKGDGSFCLKIKINGQEEPSPLSALSEFLKIDDVEIFVLL
ncbi:MAG TPA: hypothetical protein DEF25_05295 [Thermoanaerobacter sp.]|nr:hypothetical protein [Thermoanaerobacter sp.]